MINIPMRLWQGAVALLPQVMAMLLATTLASGQTYEGKQLVQADLVANVSAIVPGEPFLVGTHLKMAPGWHTYWRYPGDAGIATEIKWALPDGWQAGEIQWPIPLKLNEPGDIQIYGYHDEVLLIQQITPPRNIGEGATKLSTSVNWLVCEKICIPGEATIALTLPVSASNSPANAELFARFVKQLPSAPDRNFSESWQKDAQGLLLRIESVEVARAPVVDFFPAPDQNVAVGHPQLESRDAKRLNFRVPLDPSNHGMDSLPGVIVFGKSATASDRSGWIISAAPRASALSKHSTVAELARFLLFGFIGGFILNLMPCVLPVISLKIFGFVQQAGQSRTRIFRTGLAFVAGIFVWFLGLGAVLAALKSAGHEITWAFQFTNPYFVLGMSAVVLVFALNLFGVFEISLPQWLNRRAVTSSSSHGDAGAFVQGMFATILATPCTAPFLGTALGFAFTQSAVTILLIFFAIAAGMSVPYLLLSAQPAWLRLLPKPGPWMIRVKQFMGFLLLATLVFLFSVIGAQRGVSALIWATSFLLIIGLACWIKGAFVIPTATHRARVIAWLAILILLFGGAAYFIGGKFSSATPSTGTYLSGGWEKFTPERLASATQQGQPVFVDFTAEWCITCKFNEATVLEADAVRSAFSQHQIIKLRADWTNGDPAVTKFLKQFGRPGVPLYVLYPGGSGQPYVFPELLTKNIILEKLETVNHPIASH